MISSTDRTAVIQSIGQKRRAGLEHQSKARGKGERKGTFRIPGAYIKASGNQVIEAGAVLRGEMQVLIGRMVLERRINQKVILHEIGTLWFIRPAPII